MTNDFIVEKLELATKLMELHAQNEFKIRAYSNAVFNLDKNINPLANMPLETLVLQPGVTKSVAEKIIEIASTQTFVELEQLISDTPSGVIDMFNIKGIGPKKIRTIWKDLAIENIPNLLQACQEGQVAKLKGFGDKIQQTIIESIAFSNSKLAKLRMNKAEALALEILDQLQELFQHVEIVGDVAVYSEETDRLDFLVKSENAFLDSLKLKNWPQGNHQIENSSPTRWYGTYATHTIPVQIQFVKEADYTKQVFLSNASQAHLQLINADGTFLTTLQETQSEIEAYKQTGFAYIVPEMRTGHNEFAWANTYSANNLVQYQDLKGSLHNHSTYSDGGNTLKEMAEKCISMGLEYFGIADHSQTAVYAKGLSPERVEQQFEEIDMLNTQLAPFKIFKGIESDILGDGALDYQPELLAKFDYVVASIHSNLKMTEEKAMHRLITAIENPYTTILGHPTGRLLLERPGYPVNYTKIIDACAANNVVLEINASPWRLDLDWRYIYQAMEKGVLLSINPDAHSTNGLEEMRYGVLNARKGGLTKEFTFNAFSLEQIQNHFIQKKA
jgi:DNA polymerase (family X)